MTKLVVLFALIAAIVVFLLSRKSSDGGIRASDRRRRKEIEKLRKRLERERIRRCPRCGKESFYVAEAVAYCREPDCGYHPDETEKAAIPGTAPVK